MYYGRLIKFFSRTFSAHVIGLFIVPFLFLDQYRSSVSRNVFQKMLEIGALLSTIAIELRVAKERSLAKTVWLCSSVTIKS